MDRRKFIQRASSSAALFSASRLLGQRGGPGLIEPIGIPPKRRPPLRFYDYQLCYVPCYGQSLSMGDRGGSSISTVQRFDSLTFAGGIMAQAYSSDLVQDYSTLVPLVENDSTTNFNSTLLGISSPSETPESGTFEAVKELRQSEDGLTPANSDYQFLGSCPGHGTYSCAQLSKGTVPYQRLLDEVTMAAMLAQQMGKTFGVPCVTWMQGENDIPPSQPDYFNELGALFTDLNADILAITGQEKTVQFLIYQTAAANCFAIACAQFDLAYVTANVHIASPVYFLQTDGAPWNDEVHLAALSYKTMGAYFGSAYKRLIVNGESWKPLSPASISAQGNVITIQLNVYNGASVLADTQTTTTTNPIKPSYGFSLTNASGDALNIDNQVQVTGTSQITIASPESVVPGFSLFYGDEIDGFGGGNIRDNFGDQYVFNGGGLNIPMHNWLTPFGFPF